MRLRVGIAGCGDIFGHHARGWAQVHDCEISGVFDIDQDLARRRARDLGVGQVFCSLEELTNASNVVDDCTPPSSHFAIGMAAIEAGCHLLIEKPVVLSWQDWERLCERAEANRLKIGAVHNQKYFEVMRRANRWVDAERIGRLVRIHDQFMVTPEIDWMLGDQGHWSHELPGGRWLETLPHNLYLVHMFAGPLELDHVALTRGPGTSPGARADEVVVTLRGESCLATIHFSANCHLDRNSLTLTGTQGLIEIVPPGRCATYTKMRSSLWKKAAGLAFLEAGLKLAQMVPDRIRFLTDRMARRDAHGRLIDAFARYVRDDAPSPTPVSEIGYVVRVCEAVGQEIERKLA